MKENNKAIEVNGKWKLKNLAIVAGALALVGAGVAVYEGSKHSASDLTVKPTTVFSGDVKPGMLRP